MKHKRGREEGLNLHDKRRKDTVRRKRAVVCMTLFFLLTPMVTTKQKSRTQTCDITKEEMEGKNRENEQTKIADRNPGKEITDTQSNQKTKVKMTRGSPHISIIALYINRLNSSNTWHRVERWIHK